MSCLTYRCPLSSDDVPEYAREFPQCILKYPSYLCYFSPFLIPVPWKTVRKFTEIWYSQVYVTIYTASDEAYARSLYGPMKKSLTSSMLIVSCVGFVVPTGGLESSMKIKQQTRVPLPVSASWGYNSWCGLFVGWCMVSSNGLSHGSWAAIIPASSAFGSWRKVTLATSFDRCMRYWVIWK